MDESHEFPIFSLEEIEEARKQAEKDRQYAEKAYSTIRPAIAFLEKATGEDRDTRYRLKKGIEEAQELLDRYRHHEIPAVRRAVWKALLSYEFSRPLESRKEVEELLTNLVQRGLLVADPDGTLKAYGKTYTVPPESLFEEPEMMWTKRTLADLLNRVFQSVGERRKQRVAAMQAQANLDLAALMAGQVGRCLIEVPPEKVVQNDGTEFWRGGGWLLLQSDGQRIYPLETIGSFENAIQEAKDLGVYLLTKSLRGKSPPFSQLPSEMVRKIRLLWYLIKRGVKHAEEAKKISRQNEEFAAKATVSPEEFFLQGKTGVCHVNYQGNWWVKTPEGVITHRIPNLFLLVSREEKKDKKVVRIIDVPDHVKEFLAPCICKEFEEGDKFAGIAQPLKAVLQAVYGQVFEASRNAKKA